MSLIVSGALTVIAAIAVIITTIWFLYEAFRVHWGWGIACLFIPFAIFVFLFMHWQEAAKPFIANILATVLFFLGGYLMVTQSGLEWKAYLPADMVEMVPGEEKDSGASGKTLQDELAAMRDETSAASTPAPSPAATPVPIAAFQAELQQLNEKLPAWYQQLQEQRANLDEADANAVKAYNQEAARYQAAQKRQQELDQYLKSVNQ